MKRFLLHFLPTAILSLVVWWLLVGIWHDEGYSECQKYGLDDPSYCADYSYMAVGNGIAFLFTAAAFITAAIFYFFYPRFIEAVHQERSQ